jgi:hypothetical protein
MLLRMNARRDYTARAAERLLSVFELLPMGTGGQPRNANRNTAVAVVVVLL